MELIIYTLRFQLKKQIKQTNKQTNKQTSKQSNLLILTVLCEKNKTKQKIKKLRK